MLVFEHDTRSQRVLFGRDRAAAQLVAEITRLGSERPLVIAGTRHQKLIDRAGLDGATRQRRIAQHVPTEVATEARELARTARSDLVIAVGGGSATGLAKAVALTEKLPIVAVPATFAGSEATDVWGLTENGRKRTGVDPVVLPVSVIYDAALLDGLPAPMAAASGLNAVAHCIDSMWGPRVDPIDAALAMEGLRALRSGLPGSVIQHDAESAEQALYGCYLAAVAFASAGSGLHHKICHVLGGTFALPHAATHAVVLPYVLAFNASHAAPAAARIAAALDDDDATHGLERLRALLDAPRTLDELGFGEENISRAVDLILPVVPDGNPRPVDRSSLTRLLHAAWSGSDPRSAGGDPAM